MQIRLSEIIERGEDFDFSDQTGELNAMIQKEFGQAPYSIGFHIKPIDAAYHVSGRVQLNVDETCSRCGDEMSLSLEFPINEILTLKESGPRTSQYSRVNNFSELAQLNLGETELETDILEVAEFCYELIASATPDHPMCGAGEQECRKYGSEPYHYDEEIIEKNQKNPFHSLKRLLKN